ncbi:tyrosine-type recombinase/integrase [Nonomuraea sp. NPDC050153]|uniref:tyrosine-type recombinase/integrase n=1 Tax=Nonomuraea sp. NPDC050153 TaxID=3364359 RepID=UPI003792A5E5
MMPISAAQARQLEPATALTTGERAALAHCMSRPQPGRHFAEASDLRRLIEPITTVSTGWPEKTARRARNLILEYTHQLQSPCWSWEEEAWTELINQERSGNYRFPLAALGYLLGGHRRLHQRIGLTRLGTLADLVFGPSTVEPAVREVTTTLTQWGISLAYQRDVLRNALLDVLLSSGSPDLKDVTVELLEQLVQDNSAHVSRRRAMFPISRALAHHGLIARPLKANSHLKGPRPETLASVPAEWRDWVLRWRKLATHEPKTIESRFVHVLTAGRWAADKHPEAVSPQDWTRDIAAEYVADTLHAQVGQWAGHNHNRVRHGEELTATGKAQRIDNIRSYFCELIDWEWITPRFDPRQVFSLPLSIRAGLNPNPRIIDDAAWAKLMAAGLTLTAEDLRPPGDPARRSSTYHGGYYPLEMVRALVGVWLFAGCRINEIQRLELDCITWDQGSDDRTGESFRICLLKVPQNKTSGPFSKPVDPIVGELIEAWQAVRLPQPDITDRKTGRKRQHLFCVRGLLVGRSYLNDRLIPLLCAKAGIPETDSRGALTSHRARATIATQLLNAREPLSQVDLQQWLGHKHAASTRHYAAILQRTLSAAYRRADYFARNVRTIQVLIDRESILTGAAAEGNQPWKYYDLGDGYCSYDFFAKCPHRLACARCPFYLPKDSHRGQLLAVRDGIDQMLEQLELTEEERQALEGDRDAVAALAERLADVPTPAGPTPKDLGTQPAFIPLTTLRDSLPGDSA